MKHASRLVAVSLFLTTLWSAPPAEACVGPPPEPFCTKTLQLAIAGPPLILLPGGGTFEVSALVYFGLLEFPPGFGICPDGPYTVDIDVTANCSPGGADGAGQLLGAPLTTGYNTLTVPVTVPAGPPRRCVLSATATVTLADGMVLSEDADNVACLADPSPGPAEEPRLDLRLIGPPGSEISRVHPGDSGSLLYFIINNDPTESFSGVLNVDSVNESRQPDFSGPMPPGTAVVSISDPAIGDHFPIDLFEVSGAAFAKGGATGNLCLALPADPLDPDTPNRSFPIELGPDESILMAVQARPWGMCADGSCSRSTLDLTGQFSDASGGLACTGFVSAADTSVEPARDCDDSGEVVLFPPPPDPLELLTVGQPRLDVDAEILHRLTQIFLTENDVPAPLPIPFSDTLTEERGRIQAQFVDTFAVDSLFDVQFEIQIPPGENGDVVDVELVELNLVGAPSGFEQEAPFVTPRLRLIGQGNQTLGFYDATLQVHVVGIDNLGNRRRLRFQDIQFNPLPGVNGLRGSLTGGTVESGAGDRLDAIESMFDLRGFLSPTPEGIEIFTDGFESGNVTRWSNSSP